MPDEAAAWRQRQPGPVVFTNGVFDLLHVGHVSLLEAARNDGKAREIRDIFAGLPFQLVFPVDQFLERLPDELDLERGTSFAENAVAKARYFATRSHLPTLGEDSGLEVDALEGAPGVFSARWS